VSGPIDGPRRPLPVAGIARVTHAHEDADERRDAERDDAPPPHPKDEDAPSPAPERPPEPGKGANVDYRA